LIHACSCPLACKGSPGSYLHDSSLDVVLFYFDDGYGYGEFEAAGSCAAGVQVEHTGAVLDARLMGVAADHHSNAGGSGVDVNPMFGVDEVEKLPGQFYDVGGRKIGAQAVGVDVAADGGDRCEFAQDVQNIWIADVPGMQDVVDSGQGLEGLRPQQAVGIRNDSDLHRARASLGKFERLQRGVALAERGIVAAVGVDAKLEAGDVVEVDGVVFQLFRVAVGVEVPLLANDLA
jgi:hypothetical protein